MHGCLNQDKNALRETKAQAYMLVIFLLAALIVAAVYAASLIQRGPVSGAFEIENLKKELPMAYATGIYNANLNSIMASSAERFNEFYAGKGLELKLLFTAFDKNRNVYLLGNYSGQNCEYNTSEISGSVEDNSIVEIARETLLNDYTLTFCGYHFNLRRNFLYQAMLERGEEAVIR